MYPTAEGKNSVSFVLGVDAGNTKTIALVARLDGTIVGAGRSGCGDIYGAGAGVAYGTGSAELALAAVEEAVRAALAMAGLEATALLAGGFSMAGADWPEDRAFLRTALAACGFGRAVVVVHDSFGPLRAGSPAGTGLAVVCGTGVAIGARAADGRTWHSGSYWLEPQGGLELGRHALRAVCRADLGIDPPTSLTASVLACLGRGTVEQVLHDQTAREGRQPADLGRLAVVLLDAAHQGDATARYLVHQYGRMLGAYAVAAARQVGLGQRPFALVLAGGVLRHPAPLLMEALVARVRREYPAVQPTPLSGEPVLGAVLLALDAAGVIADQPLRQRLAATLPPAAFFATLST